MKGDDATAAVLAALLLALPGAVRAQPPEQDPPDTPLFLERLDVEIVNLDVVVTDRRGRPVTGLTREDFELRVDGEPTPIENFYAVGPEGPPTETGPEGPPTETGPEGPPIAAAPPEEAAPEPAPPAEPAPLPAAESPPAHGLHLVILFDNRRGTPGERKRVTRQLAATLEEGFGGRASVAHYDGGIKVHQPFTSDGAALAAAIRDMAELKVGGYSEAFELRNLLRDLEGNSDRADVLARIEFYAEHQAAETMRVLEALAGQVDALAGLPGRKMLLYVSGGLDLKPGEALLNAARMRFSEPGPRRIGPQGVQEGVERTNGPPNLTAAVRELTDRANSGRVVFYAIATGAASFSPVLGPEHGGDIGGNFWTPATETMLQAGLGSGLEMMAEVTGGDALTRSDNYDLMGERIEQDAGHVYSLGFRAPEGEPGRGHRVKVEVAGRDRLTVRHRESFVVATPVERASERTLAALLWGRADNPLGIAAEPLAPERSERDRDLVVLPVLVKAPFAHLTLLPDGEVHRGQITILVVAEDAEGRLSEVQTVEAPIAIPAARLDEALRGVAGYRVGLLLRPGPHRLAIGVRDEIGNVVATLIFEHDVAAPPR